jgi:hypothetical protein
MMLRVICKRSTYTLMYRKNLSGFTISLDKSYLLYFSRCGAPYLHCSYFTKIILVKISSIFISDSNKSKKRSQNFKHNISNNFHGMSEHTRRQYAIEPQKANWYGFLTVSQIKCQTKYTLMEILPLCFFKMSKRTRVQYPL